jgi:hypothetical protein
MNANAPFGFKPSNFIPGISGSYGLSTSPMAYNASACYRGDAVILSSGKVAVATVTGNTGAAVLGIAWQFKWVSIAQKQIVIASSYPGSDSVGNADVEAWFLGNPDAIFTVQTNTGGPAVQADVGSFFNFATGTPNTNSAVQTSGMTLDYSTKNASQGTLPFVLRGPIAAPLSDPTSNYNLVAVGFATQTKL